MAGFTLDDIRETFTADMTTLIGAIQDTSKTLLGAQALSLRIPKASTGRSLFEALGSQAHAILGSSSLVNIDSMMTTARALEDFSARGHEALAALEEKVTEVRAMAAVCSDAATALRSMLLLELEGQSGQAQAISAGMAAALTPPPTSPATPAPKQADEKSVQQFDFDDEEGRSSIAAAPPAGPAVESGVQEELLEVFQEETRELLTGLQKHLQALSARPSDLATATQVERIYHTMKGASATVGLRDVSNLASRLQAQFEDVVDGTLKVTPPFLGEVFRQTNDLLLMTKLPAISLGLLAPADSTVEGDRTRVFFLEEAEGIAKESAALIDALATAGPDRRGPLAKQLGRLFHRLKGSALVLGDQQVADIALSLEQECGGAGSAAVLRDGLDRLSEFIREDVAASSIGSVIDALPAQPKRLSEKVEVAEEAELWEAFVQEATELLEGIDREIFALESSAAPKTTILSLLRQVHTLKGAVSAVGLAPTGKMLHVVEDALEHLADAPILPSMQGVTSFLLAVQEEVRLNLRQARQGAVDSSYTSIHAWATRVMAGGLQQRKPARVDTDLSRGADGSRRSAATSGSSRQSAVPVEQLGDRKLIRVATERLDELMNLAGELVVNRSRLLSRVRTLKSLNVDLGRSRKALFHRVDEFRQQHEFSLGGANRESRAQPQLQAPVIATKDAPAKDWKGFSQFELDQYQDVNILARSLAELIDDLAEMDSQLSNELNQIGEDSETFSFVISRIQAEVTRTRMIAVESLFARLRLPIREAAQHENKTVDVRFDESSVTLDRTIIDALFNPMLHLVRNAVFHGIESNGDRVKAGKPQNGTLSLRARQESGQIVIEVADDGRGLDLATLKERGVAEGLVSQDVPLEAAAVKNLVFAPRISTTESVGQVAGRGVGGDVVRRAVERLNGDIRVESTAGKGTVFTITLPMTLLITQSLLLRSGKQTFAIPLFFAERIIEIEDRAMVDVLGSSRLKVGEKYLPVRRLEQLFGEPVEATVGPLIVLRIGDRRLALQVDAVLVREEVVVKNLGELLTGHPVFAGVTVRGNGELVLIVDVPGLMDHAGVGLHDEGAGVQAPARLPAADRNRLPSGSAPSSISAGSQSVEQPAAQGTAPPAPKAPAALAAPVAVPVAAPPAAILAPVKVTAVQPAAGPMVPQILFVDDSLSVRKVAEKALTELGAKVTLAIDGIDALEKLRNEKFDLLFTDLEMPRMHGYELIREVRFLPRFKDLPVVVISSRSGSKHQDQARSLGATEYLTKPFSPQMLEGVMLRFIPGWGGKG